MTKEEVKLPRPAFNKSRLSGGRQASQGIIPLGQRGVTCVREAVSAKAGGDFSKRMSSAISYSFALYGSLVSVIRFPAAS
jgi:hypothetical protein